MHPGTNWAHKQGAHGIIAAFFPQLTTALTAAFLHEGHTFHILYSNLYIINSEKRMAKFSGEEHRGRKMWWRSPGAARVPSHGVCVTFQTSTTRDQTPLVTTRMDTAWDPNSARDRTEGMEIPTLKEFKSKLSHAGPLLWLMWERKPGKTVSLPKIPANI